MAHKYLTNEHQDQRCEHVMPVEWIDVYDDECYVRRYDGCLMFLVVAVFMLSKWHVTL